MQEYFLQLGWSRLVEGKVVRDKAPHKEVGSKILGNRHILCIASTLIGQPSTMKEVGVHHIQKMQSDIRILADLLLLSYVQPALLAGQLAR